MKRAVENLARRLGGLLIRGVVRAVNDSEGLQRVKVETAPGTWQWVPRYQDYGFTSVPLPGSRAQLLCANGVRDEALAAIVDDIRFRPTSLVEGDVALYDHRGQVVWLTENGIRVWGQNVLIETAEVLRLNAPKIEIRAGESLQMEVHGKGWRETHLGGTDYHREDYTIGATPTSEVRAIAQPALDSDHPEAEGP